MTPNSRAKRTAAKRYRTVVADPPWPYKGNGPVGTGKGRGAAALRPGLQTSPGSAFRYGSMSLDDIAALQPTAEDDAHLYLWTTNAFVCEAHDIARAWGFVPKTMCTWVKMAQHDPSRVAGKTGYYFRGATEHFLFCVRGSLPLKTTKVLPTAFLWPRLPHSVKPDAFYDLVEQASHGPYLEMFARRARFGWDYWGDQSLGTAEVAA